MNETTEPIVPYHRTLLDWFSEASLFGKVFALTIIMLGIYHAALSIRALLGRRGTSSAGVHVLLLFSGPCLLFLHICMSLPIAVYYYIFEEGLDIDFPLKHGLQDLSGFAVLVALSFLLNLVLSLIVLRRGARKRWVNKAGSLLNAA